MLFSWRRRFNNFYHKHHILSKSTRRSARFSPWALCGLVETQLVKALDLLGD